MKLKHFEGVYKPREDSYLLQKEVVRYCKKHEPARVLDVGTGSGIQAISAKLAGAKEVIATDLNILALKAAEKNAELNRVQVKLVLSDLFSAFSEDEKFDLIIFNLPYLPPTDPYDLQWSGGEPLAKKFLKQARKHLRKGGRILFVFSSLTGLRTKVRVRTKETMPDGEELFVAEAE